MVSPTQPQICQTRTWSIFHLNKLWLISPDSSPGSRTKITSKTALLSPLGGLILEIWLPGSGSNTPISQMVLFSFLFFIHICAKIGSIASSAPVLGFFHHFFKNLHFS